MKIQLESGRNLLPIRAICIMSVNFLLNIINGQFVSRVL